MATMLRPSRGPRQVRTGRAAMKPREIHRGEWAVARAAFGAIAGVERRHAVGVTAFRAAAVRIVGPAREGA